MLSMGYTPSLVHARNNCYQHTSRCSNHVTAPPFNNEPESAVAQPLLRQEDQDQINEASRILLNLKMGEWGQSDSERARHTAKRPLLQPDDSCSPESSTDAVCSVYPSCSPESTSRGMKMRKFSYPMVNQKPRWTKNQRSQLREACRPWTSGVPPVNPEQNWGIEWKCVANVVKGKNAKQCREKFMEELDPRYSSNLQDELKEWEIETCRIYATRQYQMWGTVSWTKLRSILFYQAKGKKEYSYRSANTLKNLWNTMHKAGQW